MDFLSKEYSLLIGGELKKVPKSQHWKDIIIPESQWFVVNETQVYKALNYCFENKNEIKLKGEKLMNENVEKFTLNSMSKKLDEILEKHSGKLPQQVSLKLPNLKKVGENKSKPPKIELPKLKKVTEEGVPA